MTDEIKKKEMNVIAKIDTPNFKLEINTVVDRADLDDTLSFILSTFEKNYKKIDKMYGSTIIQPTLQKETKVEYPFKELSEPVINIARRMGVNPEKLIGNNLFGFKSDKPQIFDPSRFKSANTAVRALVYLFEIGLGKQSVQKEELGEAYEISKIKGRKVSQLLQDLRKIGQLEKNEITLTAKGTSEAENELKALLSL